MKVLNVLNLGAGRQSTAVHLLSLDGKIERLEASIFADVGEEPAAVYANLQWLIEQGGIPVLVRSIGKLGDHLIAGTNGAGNREKHKTGLDGSNRFASIPAYTATHHDKRAVLTGCDEGQVRRQCTKEYKVEVVELAIKRDLLGLKPRRRVPKDVRVRQFFGISVDEKHRADKIRKRLEDVPWSEPIFPLLDLGWRLGDVLDYLKARVPHEVEKSACAFCPYRSWQEWQRLRDTDNKAFQRAIEIDRALRTEGVQANKGMDQALYLNRKCIPLEMVNIDAEAAKEKQRKATDLFKLMCDDGMCGV